MNESLKVKETEIEGIRENLAKMDKELRDTQVLYHQDKSKLEALSNITERYEGYGGSVKKVMEQKEQNKGIIGVVADIITSDKKYEVAIETALGGNIQNIVTDDENKVYGILTDVSETGANDVWHIEKDGTEYLIPAIPDVVDSVDVKQGIIKIRPLKGIFEDED